MKFLKILVFFSILYFLPQVTLLAANVQLRIKVNTLECMTCYSGNLAISKFSPEVEINLIFPELSDRTIDRIIKINYLSDVLNNKNVNLLKSDSLFALLDTEPFSEVYIHENDLLVKHFTFKDIWNIEAELKQYFHTNSYSSLTENIAYKSERITHLHSEIDFQRPQIIMSENQKYIIFDSFLNLCLIFDNKGQQIGSIDGLNFSPENILIDFYKDIDSVNLKSQINQLRSLGYLNVKIEGVFSYKNKLFINLSAPSIKPSEDNERFIIDKKTVFFVYDFDNPKKETFLNLRDIQTSYFLNISSVLNDSILQIPEVHYDEKFDKFTYYLTEMSLKNYIFLDVINRIKIFQPKSKIQQMGFRRFSVSNGYYHFDGTSTINEIGNNSEIDINHLSTMSENFTKLIDWTYDSLKGITIVLLDIKNSQFKAVNYSTTGEQIYEQIFDQTNDGSAIKTMSIKSPSELILLDSNNDITFVKLTI